MKGKKSYIYIFFGVVAIIGGFLYITSQRDSVVIISHRGSPNAFPEHSFAGYDDAITKGSDHIETDLILSKDNELMVSHDNNLKRLFNVEANITEMTQADFKKIKHQNGEPLHTMTEVFDHYKRSVNYVIETKHQATTDFKMEDELINLIKAKKLEKKVIFQSFDLASLTYLKESFKSNKYMLLTDDFKTVDRTELAGIDIICVNYRHLDQGTIKKIHELGKKAYAYTVNEETDMKRLMNFGLDGFFTNETEVGIEVKKNNDNK